MVCVCVCDYNASLSSVNTIASTVYILVNIVFV